MFRLWQPEFGKSQNDYDGMIGQKMMPNSAAVEAFLAAIEPAQRRNDAQAVCAMMERLSGEPSAMWGTSMVGFGRYHYRYDSGREGDAFRIGFSPRKNALVLYIMDGFPQHAELMARLGKYTTGKSCLYVKKLSDIDIGVLEQLIAASLAHMSERYPAAEGP